VTDGESTRTAASSVARSTAGVAAFDAAALRRRSEPIRVGAELRLLLGEDPTRAREVIQQRLYSLLWRSWRDRLQPVGLDAAGFRAITVAHAREEWLWVIGDRPWDHMVDGLVGRIERRIAKPVNG
jgi:hypothetical protein